MDAFPLHLERFYLTSEESRELFWLGMQSASPMYACANLLMLCWT